MDTNLTLMIRIRPTTRRKLDAVAAQKRWTNAEATDAAFDALIAAEGIVVPSAPAASVRQQKTPATSAA